ncbi:sugar phosphate exchanger 3-like [Hydractinia symbiolongicarpus]|uniref:sugar phosphate exchanger 3-like n=1 Tax=Hydractinia symbiolongicarpus TaxID=13093 RepID=UPI00254BC719|nr:sugar phosphate exchanger 3-like [Hydractinia symbiolongicarpus]
MVTLTWHHIVIFVLTFFSYSAFFTCRKAFSNIKDTWGKTFSPQDITNPLYPKKIWEKEQLFITSGDANVFLAELDSIFMFAYTIGLFFSGMIGDRVNLRYMLSFGMCSSAILTFLFGYISEVIHMENLLYYRCIYFLNGLCQSSSLPASLAVLGNWFSKSSSGIVFGLWGANDSLGNIIGSLIVVSSLDFGYEYGMLLNSMLLFCGGIIVFFCLLPHPNEVGLKNPDDMYVVRDKSNHKAINFFTALMLPRVMLYALSFACLKMVTYSLQFWLPTYLTQGLNWDDDTSDEFSSLYDFGAILGGALLGAITDYMTFRSPVIYISVLFSPMILYIFANVGNHYTANAVVMVTIGIFLGGPANTISTVVTADLGKHEQMKDNTKALATVSGIIDGTGSLGVAIGQYLAVVEISSQAIQRQPMFSIWAGLSMKQKPKIEESSSTASDPKHN